MDRRQTPLTRHTPRWVLLCGLALAVSFPAEAAGYSLRQGEGGVLLLWRADRAEVQVDTSAMTGLSGPQVLDHVRAAFVTWTANGVPTRCSFKEGQSKDGAAKDGRNTVSWISKGWSHGKEAVAITISWYRASTGEVLESDIEANAQDHRWGVAPAKGSGKFDIQNIMAHEAGHFWGVGHSAVQSATMWQMSLPEQLTKRTLTQDDRDGIAALVTALGKTSYQENQLTSAPDSVSGGGCNMVGDTRESGLAVLALIVLLLMSRHRRGLFVLPPALLLLGPGHARADERAEQAPTAQRLAAAAPLVFQGVVKQSESRKWRGLIVTDHTVAVARCFKGPCPANRTVRTLGGVVGDLGMHVAGEAQPRPGDELMIFGRQAHGVVRALGLAAGVYRITPDGAVVPGAVQSAAVNLPAQDQHPARLERLVDQIRRGAPGQSVTPVEASATKQNPNKKTNHPDGAPMPPDKREKR